LEDLVGSGRGLTGVMFRCLPGGIEEYHEIPVRCVGVQNESQTECPQIDVYSVNGIPTCSVSLNNK
jgi:hypothetical protein